MNKRILIGISIVLTLILIGSLAFSFYIRTQVPSSVYVTEDSKSIPEDIEHTENFVKNQAGEEIQIMQIDNENSEKLIIYLHGNAGRTYELIEIMAEEANILSPAYPGYHASEGSPSEAKVYETIDLTYDLAINKLEFSPENIIFYGHSFGGSPAIYASSEYGNEIQMTILVNTFDSVRSVCSDSYSIFCWSTSWFHNNYLEASEMKGKVRHYHAIDDERIDIDKGRRLSKQIDKHVDDYEFKEISGYHSVYPEDYEEKESFDVEATLEEIN
jgi:predicted esterase